MNWDIILNELRFRTSRSSGAGGQHVNKTETRVEAIFDVNASNGLTEEEKTMLREKLASRIYESGELVVVASRSRSQLDNKEFSITQLKAVIEKGLTPKKKRKRTRIPPEVKEERLLEKKKNAEKKAFRKKPDI